MAENTFRVRKRGGMEQASALGSPLLSRSRSSFPDGSCQAAGLEPPAAGQAPAGSGQ